VPFKLEDKLRVLLVRSGLRLRDARADGVA
jgi:hypothetical protein